MNQRQTLAEAKIQTEAALAERIAKLPLWVQDHIRELILDKGKLEEDLQYAEEFAEVGPNDSTIFAEANNIVRPLGKDAVISFRHGDEHFLVELQEDGSLKVEASQDLLIEPSQPYEVVLRLKSKEAAHV
jgi:hypothetical protein